MGILAYFDCTHVNKIRYKQNFKSKMVLKLYLKTKTPQYPEVYTRNLKVGCRSGK